jgi:hypothetical protein
VDSFSYPFRFGGKRAARLDDESEEFLAQLISAAVQTHQGELIVTPTYGSLDQEFSQFDTANLFLTVTNFYPAISIDNVEENVSADGTVGVRISFSTTRN